MQNEQGNNRFTNASACTNGGMCSNTKHCFIHHKAVTILPLAPLLLHQVSHFYYRLDFP